jgi:hypothetical protein
MIPPTPVLTDIIAKIMTEILSVLAPATKQIKEGRFSKFRQYIYILPLIKFAVEEFEEKLLGDGEIEATVQRLGRLTQDEARVTVAQTLSVVHGSVGNVKVIVEGAQCLHDHFQVNF